jgi:hypothetical protein
VHKKLSVIQFVKIVSIRTFWGQQSAILSPKQTHFTDLTLGSITVSGAIIFSIILDLNLGTFEFFIANLLEKSITFMLIGS